MKTEAKLMGVASLKAHLLSTVKEVENKRVPVTITNKGRAVAQIVPMPLPEEDPIFGFYRGKIEITGDIISPRYSDQELDEFERREATHLR